MKILLDPSMATILEIAFSEFDEFWGSDLMSLSFQFNLTQIRFHLIEPWRLLVRE